MKRVPINFTEHQHNLLKKAAYDSNKSMSDVVRKAFDEYVARKKEKGSDDSVEKTLP